MKFYNSYCALLMLSLLSSTVFVVAAEEESKAITLESDTGVYDDKQGVSIYTGKVIIRQANMRLEADKVTVYMQDNKTITKLLAIGNPVKFTQIPEAGKEDVHGHSLVAEYFPETKLLVMTEQAKVWQGNNSTMSERIVYDRISEIIKAGDKNLVNQRVHVILQPNNDVKAVDNDGIAGTL